MQKHWVVLMAVTFALTAEAQWVRYPTKGAPRKRDGVVDITAKAPRTREGKPDLSGVWHGQTSSREEMKRLFGEHTGDNELPGMEITTISKYAINLFLDVKPEDVPIRPLAVEVQKARLATGAENGLECQPYGIPLATLLSEYHKIVQTPDLMLILLELDNTTRQVYLDGRRLEADPNPSWEGHSTGHWEGDTLVVESNGFNDKTWLDIMGHPHSDKLKITERYRRRDFGHLDVEMTFDDPVMYTRPFQVTIPYLLQPDTDILEYVCVENEQDKIHARP